MLRLDRRARGRGFVRVRRLERSVSAGRGRIRVARRLRPGRYRLVVANRDRCGPRTLPFRVTR
jgi:hypothetical protein